MPVMETKIEHLAKRLADLGWTSGHAEFGRQSWTIPTIKGSAVIEVHVEGNGIVGSFVLLTSHPGDGLVSDDDWESEDVKLELGPSRENGLRVHQTESLIANTLARFATILATTTEREANDLGASAVALDEFGATANE